MGSESDGLEGVAVKGALGGVLLALIAKLVDWAVARCRRAAAVRGADLLTSSEQASMLSEMQGEWTICAVQPDHRPKFDRASVSGEEYVMYGTGRSERRKICMCRSKDGTLFLDSDGTECTEWAPSEGRLRIKPPTGCAMIWKQEGLVEMENLQTSSMPDEIGTLVQLKGNGELTDEQFADLMLAKAKLARRSELNV